MLVLVHGVFDVLHIGHLHYLREARKLGDFLLVTITADRYVTRGIGQPLFAEQHRKEMLEALRCVDQCEIIYEPSAVTAINVYRPDIYVKGIDYKSEDKIGNLEKERQLVESYGGRLVILETEVQCSSTEIMTGTMLSTKRTTGLLSLSPRKKN